DELKFGGLVVTDALDMAGVAKGFGVGDAAVRALEAGADVLLMPSDPGAAIRAVVDAVRSKRLTEARIDESAGRLLAAKQRLGLDRTRLTDVEALADVLDEPEAAERAQQIADRAVTLVRNRDSLLPLRSDENACFVALTENRYTTQGDALAEGIRRRTGREPAMLDPLMTEAELDRAVAAAVECPKIVVAAFASVSVYRSGMALPGGFAKLIDAVVASGKPVALVALGNPYLIRAFPAVAAYMTTYSPVVPSEIAAVKALFGEIPASGRLPVTIPGIAERGGGK
ncbi:MAG: glycoside hydrolase family 3 N-terminal domain-containing protein, partial [Bryobacteraceae bacterium]